jgi:hypothetical protein
MNANELSPRDEEIKFATEVMGAEAHHDDRRGHGWCHYKFKSIHSPEVLTVWQCDRGWAVASQQTEEKAYRGHEYHAELGDALSIARLRAGLHPVTTFDVAVVNDIGHRKGDYAESFVVFAGASELWERLTKLTTTKVAIMTRRDHKGTTVLSSYVRPR